MKICKKAKHVLLLLWAIVRVSVLCDSHTDTDTAHPSLHSFLENVKWTRPAGGAVAGTRQSVCHCQFNTAFSVRVSISICFVVVCCGEGVKNLWSVTMMIKCF